MVPPTQRGPATAAGSSRIAAPFAAPFAASLAVALFGLAVGGGGGAAAQTPEGSSEFAPVDRPPTLLDEEELSASVARIAREEDRTGVVELWLRVGADGIVETVRLARTGGRGLDEAARALAEKTRWTPAERDGRPAAAWVLLTLGFPPDIHPLRTEHPEVRELLEPLVRVVRIPSTRAFAVTGRIVSRDTGEPIRGAQVFVAGTRFGALTGSNGAFRVVAAEAGPADLRVRLLGFRQVCVGIRLSESDMPSLVIALERAPTRRSPEVPCVELEAEDRG